MSRVNDFPGAQNSICDKFGLQPREKTLKRSVLISAGILVAILLYFGLSMTFRIPADRADLASAPISVSGNEASTDLVDILVFEAAAETHPIYLQLKGRTIPNRTVTVRSATTGIVSATPATEGARVAAGTLLCRLDIEARAARVAEAEAQVASARIDYSAASELAEKGWASPNRAASAKASLDAAEAALDSARIELARTRITAPFSGIFETRLAETGDFLSPGGACGTVTDLDPIRIAAQVTEIHAGALSLGATVDVTITSHGTQSGTLGYVARTADPATRTFAIEATLPNPDMAISAGLTTDIRLRIGEAEATPISAALLALDDAGRLGVRHLDETGTVRFALVEVVDDAGGKVWVTGLPARTRLLSAGQDYVKAGTRINPVPVSADAAP